MQYVSLLEDLCIEDAAYQHVGGIWEGVSVLLAEGFRSTPTPGNQPC